MAVKFTKIKFTKSVSKGSRFNQIYVPKGMEGLIEVGDEVEVTLVRKHISIHYSNGLMRLSEFKENLIKNIFSFLSQIDGVSLVFTVGSFLTEKISYNDIDIAVITSKEDNFEDARNKLIEKFNLKLHIIVLEERTFRHLLKTCPLTKAMFSRFISNKPLSIPDERVLDKNHIKFLLMMPEDLLDIRLNSRAFFDSLRRLITIQRFLENKSLDTALINSDLRRLIEYKLYNRLKNNEEIEENSVNILRRMIKMKIGMINDEAKKWERERTLAN